MVNHRGKVIKHFQSRFGEPGDKKVLSLERVKNFNVPAMRTLFDTTRSTIISSQVLGYRNHHIRPYHTVLMVILKQQSRPFLYEASVGDILSILEAKVRARE